MLISIYLFVVVTSSFIFYSISELMFYVISFPLRNLIPVPPSLSAFFPDTDRHTDTYTHDSHHLAVAILSPTRAG